MSVSRPMRVTIELEWRAAGHVTRDGAGRLVFPKLQPIPGLYRLRLVSLASASTYIGETANLRRRAAGYRAAIPVKSRMLE